LGNHVTRLLLIEDHTVVAEGLQILLTEIDPTMTCANAGTIAQALQTEGPFDLILLDLNLPDAVGLNGLRAIREAFDGVPVALLSGEENTGVIRMAIAEGAMGFVPKSASSRVLLAAMRLILAGGTYLPPHAFASWPATAASGAAQNEAIDAAKAERLRAQEATRLTDRQLEILMKAVQGKPNKIIARETHLAEGTVKAHLSAAFRLINVSNRTEAVFKAAQLGLTMPLAVSNKP
jgi:DNA-binding NarL/FixJ family response regulator